MTKMNAWILAARPKTLVAAFVPVAVGTCLAVDAEAFKPIPAMLCLWFAFLIQIGTNFANDYFDFKKGADTDKRIGPKRAVASGLISPGAMRKGTIFALVLAFVVGLGLLPYGGLSLLVVGLLSLLLAIAYTGGPFPLAYLGLGDIFVILFFGGVAVVCTQFVQTGVVTNESLITGFSIGLIINNLLVVNNYRDIDEDRLSGKKTLAVRFGRRFSLCQFVLQSLLAIAALCYLHPVTSSIVVGMILCTMTIIIAYRLAKAKKPGDYASCLQNTSVSVLVLGIGFCLNLLVSG